MQPRERRRAELVDLGPEPIERRGVSRRDVRERLSGERAEFVVAGLELGISELHFAAHWATLVRASTHSQTHRAVVAGRSRTPGPRTAEASLWRIRAARSVGSRREVLRGACSVRERASSLGRGGCEAMRGKTATYGRYCIVAMMVGGMGCSVGSDKLEPDSLEVTGTWQRDRPASVPVLGFAGVMPASDDPVWFMCVEMPRLRKEGMAALNAGGLPDQTSGEFGVQTVSWVQRDGLWSSPTEWRVVIDLRTTLTSTSHGWGVSEVLQAKNNPCPPDVTLTDANGQVIQCASLLEPWGHVVTIGETPLVCP